jgi:uncharacterized phage protein (TIGR01671 family)
MNDRYLFKAKRLDNGEWIIGSLIQNPFFKGVRSWISSEQEDKTRLKSISRTQALWNSIEVDSTTICQCTGLKDKNGKLIWENDICDRKEEYPEIVKYNNGDWTLDYSYSKGKESGYCYCNLGFYALERKYVEVIGNIFDNPELLESEE